MSAEASYYTLRNRQWAPSLETAAAQSALLHRFPDRWYMLKTELESTTSARRALDSSNELIPLTITAVETIGYAGRIWSHFDKELIGGFIMQAILILVAPALFAAFIYMILGRLIRTVRAEHLSLIPAKWVTRVFVISDIVSFSLQAGGGGIQSGGTLELFEMGEKIIIAGLIIQVCVFGFFVITGMLFHSRLARQPTAVAVEGRVSWRRHLYVLYATSALILVRSVFRVVEYLQGNSGYLISHEVFLYCFDMLLMALVMIIFLVWYVDDLESKGKPSRKSRGVEMDEGVRPWA